MRDLTIIIPTFKMGRYMPALFESIANSVLANRILEVIFVCDRANEQDGDDSIEIIQKLVEKQPPSGMSARLIVPEIRKGVFMSRYRGGREAKTETLLFLDSRLVLPAETAEFLASLPPRPPSLCAAVDIDTSKNVFNLYWLRSHAAIFSRRERELQQGPIEIRPDNFNDYVVGTTGFLCSREVFLKCCQPYIDTQLYSDDTLLMKDMSGLDPILIHPSFRVDWEPRDRAGEFLKHLYYRGPGFAEYHLFMNRGRLFYAVLAGVVFLAAFVVLLLTSPLVGLSLLLLGLAAATASTLFIAKGFGEFLQLAPLHVGVMAAYGFGALRGAWIVWKKRNLKSATLPLR